MEHKQGHWFTRKQGQTGGPFSARVITNHIRIGRLSMDDEISPDGEQWMALRSLPELHPPEAELKAERTRRKLDERTGLDRRQQRSSDAGAPPRGPDRRAREPESDQQHRALRRLLMEKYRAQQPYVFWPLLATLLVLLGLLLLAMLFPSPLPEPESGCDLPAAPGVNWSNCPKMEQDLRGADLSGASLRNSDMTGVVLMNASLTGADLAYANLRLADLSYSDLQQAFLLGANLARADLSHADLRDADLSHADLRDARLGNARLTGARLDNAIWIDGRQCAPGSTGDCLPLGR